MVHIVFFTWELIPNMCYSIISRYFRRGTIPQYSKLTLYEGIGKALWESGKRCLAWTYLSNQHVFTNCPIHNYSTGIPVNMTLSVWLNLNNITSKYLILSKMILQVFWYNTLTKKMEILWSIHLKLSKFNIFNKFDGSYRQLLGYFV